MKKNVTVWLDGIMELSLCALVFTLPFSKSMIEIFFCTALGSWLIKRVITVYYERCALKGGLLRFIKAFRPVNTSLDMPIAAFLMLAFLSMLTSVSLPLSAEGFFFKTLEGVMIFYIAAEVLSDRKRLNRMLVVMILSIILVGADGIYQSITRVDFIRGYPSYHVKMGACFDNPNRFAGWLTFMVPFAASIAFFYGRSAPIKQEFFFRTGVKLLLWVLTSVLLYCLLVTHSRGAWVAVVLSMLFFGIIRDRRIAALTLAVLIILPFFVTDYMKERAALIFKTELYKFRPPLWQEAVNIIRDFPLLGCGPNTYATVAPLYRLTEATGYYPHNSYLRMAAESGVLGLGAFIWIMATLFKSSLEGLANIKDSLDSGILAGLLSGLFGFLLHSFIDTDIYTIQLGNLMWFFAGTIVAIRKISFRKKKAIS